MPIKKQVVKARVDWGACPFGVGFLCTGAPNLPRGRLQPHSSASFQCRFPWDSCVFGACQRVRGGLNGHFSTDSEYNQSNDYD